MLDLAAAAHVCGDHERALEAAELCLEASHRWQGYWGGYLAAPAVAIAGAGNVAAGAAVLRSQVDDVRCLGRPGGLEELLTGFAALAYLCDDPARASRLLAWVRSRTYDVGRVLPSISGWALYEHYVRLARQALGPEQAHRCREEGRAMSEEEAVALALEVSAT